MKEKIITASDQRRARSAKPRRAAKQAAAVPEDSTGQARRKAPRARAVKAAAKAPKPRRAPARRNPIEPPPILLEGDQPAAAATGPGRKFELGPMPSAAHVGTAEAELPEAYGTRKLTLTARDPHWLYAHWDLTRTQQAELNAQSADDHLVLRLYAGHFEGHPLCEIHVHPESRHWFAHVERAGDTYSAELGYYTPVGRWTRVAVSAATVTPPDTAAEEAGSEFATIPFEFPFARLMEIIKSAVAENVPLARAVEGLRRRGHPGLPRAVPPPPAPWTPQQEQALADIVSIDPARRVWMGSLEITELVRRRLAREISSPGAAGPGAFAPGIAMPSGIASPAAPFGGGPPALEFWFNVNAELVIYGATAPDAKVTLGGHPVKLRPDGSFSCRFALPDGRYDLSAVAVSADNTDARAANLKFTRQTEHLGDVGAQPEEPGLAPPRPENP